MEASVGSLQALIGSSSGISLPGGARAGNLSRSAALAIAPERIETEGVSGRIELLAGDAAADAEYGRDYDLVLVSNLLHAFGPEECASIVERAARALSPGGRLVVKEFVLEEGGTRPTEAAIFSVNMLVHTEKGRGYSIGEIRAWLERAGLAFAGTRPVDAHSTLVVGRKEG